MTKRELEEKIELYERQINGLTNEIKKLEIELGKAGEEEIPEFPEFHSGDIVWCKNNAFDVVNYINRTSRTKKYNNFHTVEYAKECAEKCREIAMLLHCKWHIDRDYVPNWKDGSEKYCVTYNHDKGGYITDFFYKTEYPTVYFSTKHDAKKAADWMNKHYKRNNES